MAGPASHGDADVTIVGAGPTGLFAAALLAESGVSVRILDKAPSAAKESRAFAVQARTLELLHFLGLADAFLDRGIVARGARVYVDGREVAGFDFEQVGRPDTPFPIVFILPQAETEAILVEHLTRKGLEVERGVTASALAQDEDGVTLRASWPGGSERQLRSRFLLGADGAHSFVRHALGLTFEGAPYAQTFLLADCTVEGDLRPGPFSAFFRGSHFGLWFPLRGGRFGRVIVTSEQAVADGGLAGQGPSGATLPEVEEALRAASGLDLRLKDAAWLSRYRVHHRGVNRYGVGRVFVAGDAAHIHSPAGGQGMNTGMGDVANLAWKIAAALRCNAPSALLDSYDAERRPVGETVLAATDRAFSFVTGGGGWAGAVRNVVLPIAMNTVGRSGFARSRFFGLLSELGIRYEPNFAADRDDRGWGGGPAPGRRAPDAAIGRKLSVFDLLAGYRFKLLAFSREPLDEPAIERLSAALTALREGSPLPLDAHLIGYSLLGRHPALHQVEAEAVLPAYGLTGEIREALYLIRPDGHVAWRAPSLDLAPAAAFMRERFGG